MIIVMVLCVSTVMADMGPQSVVLPVSSPAGTQLSADHMVAARAKTKKRRGGRKRQRANAAPTVSAPPELNEEPAAEPANDGWNVEKLDFAEVAVAPEEAPSLFSWDARLDFEHHTFFDRTPGDQLTGRDNLEARLGVTYGTSDLFVRAEGDARKDFATPQRDRIAFLEAYGHAQFGPVELRVGHQLTAWGATTLVVPGDIVDRIDYRDVVRPEKIASINGRAALAVGRLRLELHVLPRPTVHRLPFDIQAQLGGEPGAVSMSASHVQGAARLVWSLPSFDVSLAIANIYDHVPTLELDPVTFLPRTSQRRLWVVVVDAETTVGKARFAIDAVGFEPNDDNRAYGIAVAGVDYRSAQFFTDHSVHTFFELEAARRAETVGPSGLLDAFRTPFSRAAVARVTYEVGETGKASASAYIDLESGASAVNLTCEVKIIAATRVRFGFDLLGGDQATLFGRYRDDSRVFAELSALF